MSDIDDNSILKWIISLGAFGILLIAINSAVERYYAHHEATTAIQAGLVQRYDADAKKVIWVKPEMKGTER